MLSVIGVHSSSVGGSSIEGSPGLTAGHAWLTLHYENGRQSSIGLWAEGEVLSANHLIKDPYGIISGTAEKFEVNFDLELQRHYKAEASRFFGLYRGQQTKAIMALGRHAGWRFGHTCASWATEKLKEIFGVQLASQEGFGLTNTPRALGQAIRAAEGRDPTSVSKPKYVGHGP